MKTKLYGTNPVKQAGILRRAWQQRTSIGRMLRDAWRGQYRMTFLSKAAMLITLLYVVSPIDLIPDFLVPLLGWGDDAGVLFLLLGRMATEAGRYERQRHSLQQPG